MNIVIDSIVDTLSASHNSRDRRELVNTASSNDSGMTEPHWQIRAVSTPS